VKENLLLVFEWIIGLCFVLGFLAWLTEMFDEHDQCWCARALRWLCDKLGI
jgi:hypothetical protein